MMKYLCLQEEEVANFAFTAISSRNVEQDRVCAVELV